MIAKNTIAKFLLIGIGTILSLNLVAQIQITPATDDPFTPDNLIRNVFLGDGVEITNLEFTGVPQAVGLFSNGDTDIDLSRGIVMSTGEVSQIPDASSELNGGDTSGGIGDSDLANLVEESLLDLAKYEITFIPISDQLSFRYVFASEEYEEFVCDRFNDVFGFFISGPDPNGGSYDAKNIALVPDPADPDGLTFTDFPVSTNSINHGSRGCDPDFATCGDCTKENESLLFSQYYKDNSSSSTFVFDGYSTILTARIDVIPCQEYTIKLAISDVADNGYSSAVFLEAKSFSSPTLKVDRADDSTVDGSISEGCTDAIFRFKLPSIATKDTFIEVEYITDADFPIAEMGTDYTLSQNTERLVIREGQDEIELEIGAILDEELEPEESILIGYQKNICDRDTLRIIIRDKIIETIDLVSPETPYCTDGYTVDAEDPGGGMSTLTPFTSRQLVRIENANESYSDQILVDGIEPGILSQGLIAKVCIDSLEHIVPEDLDIYLSSPGGQVLELSTDNGGFGEPNVTVFDKFVNTCFVINGAPNINNGDPLAGQPFGGNPTYTGDFLPEGDWSDLLDGNNPVNGIWKLTIIDDSGDGSGGNSTTGALRGWSIEFNAPYEVSYTWTLPDGTVDNTISNPNILNTTFTPTAEQTYLLTATDSYGCEFSDEITVTPGDVVLPPDGLNCSSTSTSIIFSWENPNMASDFDVLITEDTTNIAEEDWENIGFDRQAFFDNLLPDTKYFLGVRSKSDNCAGESVIIECQTGACTQPDITDIAIDNASACADNGRIIITPQGEGPFVIELNEVPDDDGVFTGLEAGMYPIKVTDVTGCAIRDTLEVRKDSISITISELIPVGCFGGNGALIAVPDPSPVVATYDVAWNNAVPQSSTDPNVFTLGNVPSDEYTILITDEKGCTATDTFMLEQPTEVKASGQPIITPLTCKDDNDGTINVPIEGGTAPYTFDWRDNNFQNITSDSIATGLSPGDYTVFVTDSRGCSMVAPVSGSIPRNDGFNIDPGTVTPPKCADGSDGIASFNNRDGQGPLSWQWSNEAGEVVSTEPRVNTLSSGLYTVEAKDINGCPEVREIVVPDVEPIVIDEVVVVPSNCFSESVGTGSISISVSGGENAFDPFYWFHVEGERELEGDADVNSEELNSILRGNYLIRIFDTNGCRKDTSLFVDSPPEFEITAAIDTVDCFGDATGGVDISVGGATAPYNYDWFGGGVFTNDEDPTNLPRNEYAVRVTDNLGCIKDSLFFVPENPQIKMNLIADNVACKNEGTGKIQLLMEGGRPGFNFDWRQNGEPLGIDDALIENLSPARYTVTITDQLDCAVDTNYVVTEPEAEFIVNVIQDTICKDAFEPGELIIDATGGIPTYTYLWDDGSMESSNDLFAGDYTVQVSDQAGCVRNLEATMVEVSTFEISQIDASTAKCADQASGTATINIENINYEFGSENLVIEDIIWGGLPEEKELTTDKLKGGEWHFVELIDKFGCSALDSVFIDNPEPIGIELVSLQDISCFAEENGMININPINGEGPFEYNWSQSTNVQTTQKVTDLRPGLHQVTLTDVNGCDVEESYTIEEPSLLVVEGRAVRSRCFGDNSGRVDLLVTGGIPDYQYSWSNQSTDKNIVDIPVGDYVVTVTDDNGCMTIEEVVVEGPEAALDFTMEIIPPECPGLNTGIIEVSATGGNGFYSYSYDSLNFVRNETIVGLVDGNYTVTVKDRNGCSVSKDTMITNPAGLTLFIGRDTILPAGQTVFVGTDIRRGDMPVDGTEPFEFEWSIFPDEVEITGFEEFINIENLQESIIVTLSIMDSLGCTVTAKRRIDVQSMRENLVEVPSGFTPNGDGTNDVLKVLGRNGITINSFRVYSRWGELVYNQEEYLLDVDNESLGWNGRFKGKEMNPGTFVWIVEATFEDGFQFVYRGNTQLLR